MHSMLPSEAWHQFVAGDSSCFCELFKKYYMGLLGYGLKLCNNPNLVEDSIQDLFESVWKRREELTHITSPNVYLYVSLRRSIVKRKKKQNRIKDLKYADQKDHFIHFGAEDFIIREESRKLKKEELKNALNHLSNKQKEVIFLHFYNGMSYSEIAEILAINRQSVSNHMYRGIKTLRSVLKMDVLRLVI